MDTAVSKRHSNGSEIAVIGMVCRWPGANDVEAFWRNLRDGIESISFLKDEELEASGVDPAAQTAAHYVKAAAVIDGVERFDASFFGLTPREAEIMDPQQRLFLECAWEALEQAGYDSETYRGAIGLFAGARTNTYLLNIYSHPELVKSLGAFQVGLGNDLAFLSTRVSYKLNLTGPSCSVHTACSTALVCVHLACQSLLTGECQMALAGAVAVNVPQRTGYLYQPGGIVSPDGHCRAFDAGAQGTIFGSGIGILVLKPLEDALADGDTIHAVIKGTAVNNDGALKASFTAPSVQRQSDVISEALANAEVDPKTIGYVEAHGTGTALGDAIEIRALTKVFGARTERKELCPIGSVKTNFGHLDVAAGGAGLFKTILALKHRSLPPSLHFETPHPNIDLPDSPFYVNSKLSEWKGNGTPRRAGVSSFGIGGTNAHIVLEEAPPLRESGESRPYQLVALSARSAEALETITTNLAAQLRRDPELNLADVAYTLGVGRRPFAFRRIAVGKAAGEIVSILEELTAPTLLTESAQTGEPPVVFMFPGQGTQYVNMGLELYRCERRFREEIDRCAAVLRRHLKLDLRTVLYPDEAPAQTTSYDISQTWLAQPALFAVEYALARLWMEWGVRPRAMIGHSIGEYVAACISGVLTLEDALSLVATRGRLMQQQPQGGMLAVPLSEQELSHYLNGKLSVAAINEPSLCVASGSPEAVDVLEQDLAKKGLRCRRLATLHAFHSRMMEPAIGPFVDAVRRITLRPPQTPYVSNVTGTWITAEEATNPEYWGRHLRETVRFADGVDALLEEPDGILLEVGPGGTLGRLVKRQPRFTRDQVVLASMKDKSEECSDEERLLAAVGRVWTSGFSVNWPKFYAGEHRHRIPLPTYPFERQRYWIPLQTESQVQQPVSVSAAKEPDIADWFYRSTWKTMPLLPVLRAPSPSTKQSSWLVFSDTLGLGASLASRLEQEGEDVLMVTAGERFCQITENAFTIDPALAEDYEALLKTIRSRGPQPAQIIHLWSSTSGDHSISDPASFHAAQETGFHTLLYLARAIRKENLTEPIQLWVISNGLHQVESRDVLLPEKATLLGACTVLPQEFANLKCRTIDVNPSEFDANQVIGEIKAQTDSTSVAYRASCRWVQSFEPLPLDLRVEPRRGFRENGVYLITGGLGGVGLLVAECLAKTAHARLVLTGRAPFPDRREWDQLIDKNGDEHEISRKIRRLRALEEFGGTVKIVSADVSDATEMEQLVARIYEEYGQLNGVLHVAGVTSGPSLYVPASGISPSETEIQFQPKAYGLYVLENVLRGRDIDFCLLFSSNAAILGGIGLVAYSAANRFMDAFAQYQSRRGTVPWISANWDPWPEETKKYEGVRTSVDQFAMTPQESQDAFKRVARLAPEGQIIIATGAFQSRLRRWASTDRSDDGQISSSALTPDGAEAGSAHPRGKSAIAYVAPRNDTERLIAEIWQEVLGIQQVGIDDNFFDLGGHSLLLIQVEGKLREVLRKELSMVDLFKYSTVGSLAEYLTQNGGQETLVEPDQSRIEKQIEARNRRRQLHEERAEEREPAPGRVDTPIDEKFEVRRDILRMLSQVSPASAEEDLL